MKTNIKTKAFSLTAAAIGAYLLASSAVAEPAPVAQTVRCPEGSTWDGKGCWAKNLKAVSR